MQYVTFYATCILYINPVHKSARLYIGDSVRLAILCSITSPTVKVEAERNVKILKRIDVNRHLGFGHVYMGAFSIVRSTVEVAITHCRKGG